MIMSKSKNDIIHDKAIRLIEGGVVEVDGLYVRAVRINVMYDTCNLCEMDCLCHFGTEMLEVCNECDRINADYYYLKLVNEK